MTSSQGGRGSLKLLGRPELVHTITTGETCPESIGRQGSAMWCSDCQQDVAAILSRATGRHACPRCGREFLASAFSPAHEPRPKPPRTPAAEFCDLCEAISRFSLPAQEVSADDAPIDAIVLEECPGRAVSNEAHRHVAEATGIEPSPAVPERPAVDERWHRVDAAHETVHGRKSRCRAAKRRRGNRGKRDKRRSGGSVSFVLLLGLAGFTVGGTLLAVAFVQEDFQLWNQSMPVALAGAMVTLFGLVLQLDRLWQENRENVAQIKAGPEPESPLHASDSGTTHRSHGAHAADETSPMAMLADLRRQVDRLAERLQQEELR